MISVINVSKEFVTTKKYSGFKGAVRGLFTKEIERNKAVDNISFDVKKGEIVGFIGSNGAGKSTTIKMMTGIIKPTSGYCVVDGYIPNKNRIMIANKIGVVFGQRTQLWWDLPLSETFSVLKEIYQIDNRTYKKNLEFLNDVLEIGDFMTSTVRTLSLGQRMRADLAAALLHNPKILFLDEPTIGLDVFVKEKMREAIRLINSEQDTTIILTTHDLEDVEQLCSKLIIMDSGKIVFNGGMHDFCNMGNNFQCIKFKVESIEKIQNLKNSINIPDIDIFVDKETVNVIYNPCKIDAANIIAIMVKFTRVYSFEIQKKQLSDNLKNIYKKKRGNV